MKRGKTSAPGENGNPEANRGPASAPALAGVGVGGALDALYAAPFDRFVALRTELARGLRSGGDPAGARAVAAAPKPTRTAWALNHVARRSPAVMNAVVDAWKVASTAPLRREGVDLVDAARRYREAVAEVVREARAALAPDGVSLSPAQARRMAETLQALVRDESARAELLRGRLTRDVAVEDPFAGLDAHDREGDGEPQGPNERADQEPEDEREKSYAPKERAEKSYAPKERAEKERAEKERAEKERADHERLERERAANQRAERERAEREAKARAREALRAKIASAEAAVEDAHRRVQDAKAALAHAQEGLRRSEKAAEPYEAELASLRHEWAKLAR
ncbi:MAG TPA: hypothetical protein VK841_03095 [Polyangiaceae bacterium]|jgi:hypothetical protein|nr:hypothetical protein [Polyangiaceae bacterium]